MMNFLKIICSFCFLYVVLAYSAVSQNLSLEDLKIKVSKMTLKDTLAIKQVEQEWIKISEINANELDFGLKYRIDKETISNEDYYTLFIWQKGRIIYREIFTIKENWELVEDDFYDVLKVVEAKTVHQSYDSLQLVNVNRLYEKIYGVKMDIGHLKNN